MSKFDLGGSAHGTDLAKASRRRHGAKKTRSEQAEAKAKMKSAGNALMTKVEKADLFFSQEKYLKRKKVVFEAAELFEQPFARVCNEDVQAHFVTQRRLNPISFIEVCRRAFKINHVWGATFHLNLTAIRYFYELACEGIPVDLVISKFFPSTQSYVRWVHAIAHMAIKEPLLNVGWAYTHAKITVVAATDETGRDRYFVLSGSGNLTQNTLIESYIMDDSAELGKFHANWIENIVADPNSTTFSNKLAVQCKPGDQTADA